MPSLPTKDRRYYLGERTDLLEWHGGREGRVLEVGCGEGGNARWLRAHGARDLVGVEVHPESAAQARAVFDHVESRPIEDALQALRGPFDLIICADVLEHLVDPWDIVRRLGHVAAPDGEILVSMPNIRYLRALVRIAFGAGFRPESEGVFDATHLHFFTKQNIAQLLVDGGWQPLRWGYPAYRSRSPDSLSSALARTRGVLSLASRGLADEWLAGQWWVTATKRPDVRAQTRSSVIAASRGSD
jgi:SAM-dependent methyltransferase